MRKRRPYPPDVAKREALGRGPIALGMRDRQLAGRQQRQDVIFAVARRNLAKSAGSNSPRTARRCLFTPSRIPPTDGRSPKAPAPVAPRSPFAPELRWASGRNRMLTFRIAITAAVMAFITALTACLIFIQGATYHAAAREA